MSNVLPSIRTCVYILFCMSPLARIFFVSIYIELSLWPWNFQIILKMTTFNLDIVFKVYYKPPVQRYGCIKYTLQ